MPLLIIAAGVALLLVLMIGFKVNGFIALVLVAAVVGFAEGMDAQAVLHSIQGGIGGTLGGLAMIRLWRHAGEVDFRHRGRPAYRHYADCDIR
jgi:H+/gluconate symporter-like permease